ncbi:MAG: hypothetical protein ACI906_005183 [Candidatus Latescibacterota bacterium]|jgi:uncharacterized protein YbbC (DUF1343 family)
MPVRLGCERLLDEEADLIRGRRVGLITNHSGVDAQLVATADRLHESDLCELVALFGPEHGIRGAAQDGEKIGTFTDPQTGVPAYSLYGETREPDADMLESIELMLFDIQDVGARFYTYLYTMSMSMAVCARQRIPFAVLDRPNPIGGEHIAGNILDPAFASFVGRYPIPIRYGLSIGELAQLFNDEYDIGVELHIVKMQGWQRTHYWDDCLLPWVPPSPNMPTLDTAIAYPGTCFFEGTNISEGRGTTRPFEQFGAPFIDGPQLADKLNELNVPGARFRPVFFQPSASKYSGELCQGAQLHVTERKVFDPVHTGFAALIAVRNLYSSEFAWRVPSGGIHNFDRLAGGDKLRQTIDAGIEVEQLLTSWQSDLDSFATVRQRYLLYR